MRSSDQLRRASLSNVSLVILGPKLLLEPVDHVLEWIVVLVVEEVSSRFNLDELFYELLFRNVS